MIQTLIYLSINAGVLAGFACLWAMDRKLNARNPERTAAAQG
jgi:hypothetical protein